jgi:hypothetical protein
MTISRFAALLCAVSIGMGAAALAACGEDRGSVDVEGGGSTGGSTGGAATGGATGGATGEGATSGGSTTS